jgi:hypothetical protein
VTNLLCPKIHITDLSLVIIDAQRENNDKKTYRRL